MLTCGKDNSHALGSEHPLHHTAICYADASMMHANPPAWGFNKDAIFVHALGCILYEFLYLLLIHVRLSSKAVKPLPPQISGCTRAWIQQFARAIWHSGSNTNKLDVQCASKSQQISVQNVNHQCKKLKSCVLVAVEAVATNRKHPACVSILYIHLHASPINQLRQNI